jgi:polysaccharide export outer membrane protein
VLVRIIKNNTSSVTVVGEVNSSNIMALTPKGERLLDAVASGGGLKQPLDRMAVQLSRGNTTVIMPINAVIRDPQQNIMLSPGDVVTALYQPQSFSVLGATGKNEEIPFEAQGISLAQALARSGGLNDTRADARGLFIFRFEDADLVSGSGPAAKSPDGKVPVVYQVDLRDPAQAAFAAHTGPAAVLIGPEGGFDAAERAAVRALPQARPITLGPRILRGETAAIAATALWMGVSGDW